MKTKLITILLLLLSYSSIAQLDRGLQWIGTLPQTVKIKVGEIHRIDSMIIVYGSANKNWDEFLVFQLRGFCLIKSARLHKKKKYHGNLEYSVIKDSVFYLPVGPYTKDILRFSLRDTLDPVIEETIYSFIPSYRERKRNNEELFIFPFYLSFDKKGVKVFMDKDFYKKLIKNNANISSEVLKERIKQGFWGYYKRSCGFATRLFIV